jgi:hypothetical protein
VLFEADSSTLHQVFDAADECCVVLGLAVVEQCLGILTCAEAEAVPGCIDGLPDDIRDELGRGGV